MIEREEPGGGGARLDGRAGGAAESEGVIGAFLSSFGEFSSTKLVRDLTLSEGLARRVETQRSRGGIRQNPDRIEVSHDARKHERVDPVEDPAVARNDGAGVLHSERTLQDGFAQVAGLPEDTRDQRERN